MKILCLCRGNHTRSPMLEAMLRAEIAKRDIEDVIVESAGVLTYMTDCPADARSVECMRERGLDISRHRGRWIGALSLQQFTHIICTDDGVQSMVWGHRPSQDTRLSCSVMVMVYPTPTGA